MPYNRVQVRAFLSVSETELFESSLPAGRRDLSDAELRRRLQRARTLRDKSRDLLQRQKLTTRARTGSKVGVSGQANKRTAQKAAALAEVLSRFEAETAARLASSATRAGKSTPSRRTTPPEATPARTSKNVSAKKVAAKPGGSSSRGRPAALVLREALDKKRADETAQVAAVKRAGASKQSAAAVGSPAPGGVQPTPPSTRARAVASRLADSNLSHVQGHTSTQVRRNQAKRDQKG
ncbi:MAG: hypothetical protein ABI364_00125 [Caldimonas sp.]